MQISISKMSLNSISAIVIIPCTVMHAVELDAWLDFIKRWIMLKKDTKDTNAQIAYDIAPIVNQFYNKLNGILRECGKFIMSYEDDDVIESHQTWITQWSLANMWLVPDASQMPLCEIKIAIELNFQFLVLTIPFFNHLSNLEEDRREFIASVSLQFLDNHVSSLVSFIEQLAGHAFGDHMWIIKEFNKFNLFLIISLSFYIDSHLITNQFSTSWPISFKSLHESKHNKMLLKADLCSHLNKSNFYDS